MSLKDFNFLPDYNKENNDIAQDFYIPAMMHSSWYDRISGYFGSTVYIIAWSALHQFVRNNGKIRIICSPCISEADKAAMTEGYSAKNNEIIKASLENEIEELFDSEYLNKPARVLACLVAEGIVDIKIAVPESGQEPDLQRLFHDKVGIFTDKDNNSVGFRGSMNETFQGLSEDGNAESIDVFPSWLDERDKIRVTNAKAYFEMLWNKDANGTCVYDFPEAVKKELINKSNGYDWRLLAEEISTTISLENKWKSDRRSGKKPRKHQVTALEAWVNNNRRGILEHATGSGKTYTAICAIKNALKRNKVILVLVPSKLLLYQWKREIKENITDIELSFLLCGDGNNSWKRNNMLNLWTRPVKGIHKITIAIMDTAANEKFYNSVYSGSHLMLVADEVHRLGSPARRITLKYIDAMERLGLSATPVRYGDTEGTQAVFDYFGGIIPPVFSLKDAIDSGVLTRYYYYPLQVVLTDNEQERWDILTKEINKILAVCGAKADNIDSLMSNNNKLKKKFIARARIVRQAINKNALALETIRKHYRDGQRWIIYCDNQGQLKDVLTLLLLNGYEAFEYHSEMQGDREETLKYFSVNGGILVSIKCLDEGVDIPETTHALILASSKNPREFIQRRGRILRKFEGKHFADLYDAIVIPRQAHDINDKSVSIIEAELGRAIQFGEWAENPSCIADLKIIANKYCINYKESRNGGYEDDKSESE